MMKETNIGRFSVICLLDNKQSYFILLLFLYLWKSSIIQIWKKQHELGTTFITKTPRRHKRLRIEQDDTRLGFEVDYDRIIFSAAFRSLQDKTK
jgi:hypothetical protein